MPELSQLKRVLVCLYEEDRPMNTREIKEKTGIPTENIRAAMPLAKAYNSVRIEKRKVAGCKLYYSLTPSGRKYVHKFMSQ